MRFKSKRGPKRRKKKKIISSFNYLHLFHVLQVILTLSFLILYQILNFLILKIDLWEPLLKSEANNFYENWQDWKPMGTFFSKKLKRFKFIKIFFFKMRILKVL
jgi:hypothetical protein